MRKKLIGLIICLLIALTQIISVGAFADGTTAGSTAPTETPVVRTNGYKEGFAPTASLASGKYQGAQEVTLTSAAAGASIYYTLDGSVPVIGAAGTKLYNGAITIGKANENKGYLLRAAAYKDGYLSDIADYEYDIVKAFKNVAATGTITTSANTIVDCRLGPNENPYDSDNAKYLMSWVLQDFRVGAVNVQPENGLRDGYDEYFFEFDFGQIYTVNQVFFSMWHDWGARSEKFVIKFSETADFAEYTAVHTGSYNPTAQTIGMEGGAYNYMPVYFSPISARYARFCGDGVDSCMIGHFSCYEGDYEPTRNIAPESAFLDDTNEYAKTNVAASGSMTFSTEFMCDMRTGGKLPYDQSDIGYYTGKVTFDYPEGVWGWSFDNTAPLRDGFTEKYFQIDFGGVHNVNQIHYSPWHEWGAREDKFKIELSETEDFSNAVKVFEGTYTPDSQVDRHDGGKQNVMTINFDRVNARYARILSVEDSGVCLSWFACYETNTIKGNPVEGLSDGSFDNNSWNGVEWSGANRYVTADLKGEHTISGVLFGSAKTWEGIHVSKIEVSTTSDFAEGTVTTVLDNKGGYLTANGWTYQGSVYISEYYKCVFEPVTCRYVRFYGSNEQLRLNEVEIYTGCLTKPAKQSYFTVNESNNHSVDVEKDATKESVLTKLTADYGTSVNLADESIFSKPNDGNYHNRENLTVTWNAPEDYDSYYGGSFEFSATLSAGYANTANPYNAGISVTVNVPQRANPTELKAYISALQIAENDYTPATYAVYSEKLQAANAVVAAIEADPEAKTQGEVDVAFEQLTAAVEALIERADKSALETKIEAVKNASAADYTPATFSVFTEKLNAAQTVKANLDSTQAEADAALEALTAAYEALAPKANKTALNAKIAEATALTAADYTSASFSAVTDALGAANTVVADENATQAAVNNALKTLTDAVTALERKGDKTALEARYNEVKNYSSAGYTEESFRRLTSALTDAKAVLDNADASVTQVNAALNELNASVTALVALGDKTALNAKIAEAKALNTSNYTTASVADFEEALGNAEVVADKAEAVQAEIDEAIAALENAKNALVARGDKTALNESLARTVNESDYTIISYISYATAKETATSVAANVDATQAMIDEAKAALDTAYGNLQKLGDKTALKAKLTEAKALSGADYTAESYAALEKAIEDGEAADADAQATETEVAEALSALETAMGNLKKAGKKGCKGTGEASVLSVFALFTVCGAVLLLRKKEN